MRRQVSTTARQTQLAALLVAVVPGDDHLREETMMGTAIDWNEYGPCSKDGAERGQPCTTRRMIRGKMVDDPISIPHSGRPWWPEKEPVYTAAQIVEAIFGADDSAVHRALGEVYDRVRSLGGSGLHSENQINRQDALDAINAVRRRWRSTAT